MYCTGFDCIAEICFLIRLSKVVLATINSMTQLESLLEYYIHYTGNENKMFKK